VVEFWSRIFLLMVEFWLKPWKMKGKCGQKWPGVMVSEVWLGSSKMSEKAWTASSMIFVMIEPWTARQERKRIRK